MNEITYNNFLDPFYKIYQSYYDLYTNYGISVAMSYLRGKLYDISEIRPDISRIENGVYKLRNNGNKRFN